MTKAKSKGGRPKKPAAERKRNTLRFRATDEVWKQLVSSATRRGRSLSEEIEARMTASLDVHSRIEEALTLAYGARVTGLLIILGAAMCRGGSAAELYRVRNISVAFKDTWIDEPYAFAQARQAALRVLDLAKPDGEPSPSQAVVETLSAEGDGVDDDIAFQ